MNSVPTETDRRSAIKTSMIEGGMRMPSVPDAQIVPVAKAGW